VGVFDLCLTQDLNDLRASPEAAAIAQLPIWLGDAPPAWTIRSWNALKHALLADGKGWEVWVDWYENRIAGKERSKAGELAYVEVPNELWVQGSFAANSWLQNRIYESEAGHRRSHQADLKEVLHLQSLPNSRRRSNLYGA
jgi:hypothetical protein